MKKTAILGPMLWSSLTFVLGAALASYAAHRDMVFLDANPDIAEQIIGNKVPFQVPIIYFFAAVAVIALILFLIPVSKLKWLFGFLFIILYAWGIFVVLWQTIPSLIVVTILAIAGGLAWFFIPKVWLHNILMLIALAGIASVFGILINPWPVMGFLLIVAVYDFLAVRFGFMMWMAKRLSQSNSLPAFVVPKTQSNWNQNMKTAGIQNLVEGEAAEREYSILGGGDIGFPLILMVSVLSVYGFTSSLIVAAFSLVGLISAYVIQRVFLKGKPMPAIPPIAVTSLIGLLIIHFIIH